MRPPEATGAFLRSVLAEVRWKQAHKSIARELGDHVEDQARAFVAEGMDEPEAERAAIAEMGEPLALGAAFDAAYRPRPTWQLLLPVGLTLLCGLLLHIFLYAPIPHMEGYEGESLLKEILALAIGGLGFMAAYGMNHNWVGRLSWPLYALLLLIVWGFSERARDVAGGATAVFRLFRGNYTRPATLLLLLPLAFTGILYSLRRLGVWGILICDALMLLIAQSSSHTDVAPLLLMLTLAVAVMTAAILRGVCRGKKWLLILLLALPFIAIVLHQLRWRANLWSGLELYYHPFFYGMEDVGAQFSDMRWFGRGSADGLAARMLEYSLASEGEQWRYAVDWLPLYVGHVYGLAAALALVLLPLSVIVIGGVRVLRLSGRLGRLLGMAALLPLLLQWLLYMRASVWIAYTPYPLPLLSVGYLALIVNMTLLGVAGSVLRTDGLR